MRLNPGGLWSKISVALLLTVAPILARDFMTLESTYLGDGLFEYKLTFPDDRYWDQVSFGSVLGLASFTDFVQIPEGWDVIGSPWQQDPELPQPTPYQGVFRAHSDAPGYNIGTVSVAFTPHWRDWARPLDTNTNGLLVLYANLSCLVPTTETGRALSPTNVVGRIPGYPELEVQGLVLTNHQPVGLRFNAGPSLPVTIQASDDLKHWKAIASAQGAAAPVTWISSPPFPTGKSAYYRVVVQRATAN
jgi:hypothetical protein